MPVRASRKSVAKACVVLALAVAALSLQLASHATGFTVTFTVRAAKQTYVDNRGIIPKVFKVKAKPKLKAEAISMLSYDVKESKEVEVKESKGVDAIRESKDVDVAESKDVKGSKGVDAIRESKDVNIVKDVVKESGAVDVVGQKVLFDKAKPKLKADTIDVFPYLKETPVFVTPGSISTPRPFQWKAISQDDIPFEFSPEELETLDGKLDRTKLDPMCSLGVHSSGGGQVYHMRSARAKTGCFRKNVTNRLKEPRYSPNYMIKFVPSVDSEGTERNDLFGVKDLLEMLPDKSDVMFLGDSVMHQYFDSLTCSLARESKPSQFTERKRFNRKKSSWRIGSAQRDEVSYTTRNNHSVKLVLHREYVFSQDGNTIKEACAGCVKVLVLNFGLHWNQVKAYENDLKVLLKYLKQHCFSRGIQIIFRGTTTQHFLQYGGNFARRMQYTKKYGEAIGLNQSEIDEYTGTRSSLLGCEKVRYENQTQLNTLYDWRNRLATKVFQEQGFQVVPTPWGRESTGCVDKAAVNNTIFYIPAGEVTFDQYDKHTLECTHFCSTPQFWEPLHDAIYLALRQTDPRICSQKLMPKASRFKPGPAVLPKVKVSTNCNFQIESSLLRGVYGDICFPQNGRL